MSLLRYLLCLIRGKHLYSYGGCAPAGQNANDDTEIYHDYYHCQRCGYIECR